MDKALEPKALLERFIVNNAELEQLESLLNQFNIFEAVGMVRQEIRHSPGSSPFCCNPNGSHHLRDVFLKTFLKTAVFRSRTTPTVSPIEVDVATLTDTEGPQ